MLGFLHSPKRRENKLRQDALMWWSSLSLKKQLTIEKDYYQDGVDDGDSTDIDIEVMYEIYK